MLKEYTEGRLTKLHTTPPLLITCTDSTTIHRRQQAPFVGAINDVVWSFPKREEVFGVVGCIWIVGGGFKILTWIIHFFRNRYPCLINNIFLQIAGMWTIIHARILLHQATNFGINIVIIRFSIRRHCGVLENGFPFWMFPKGIRSENLSGVGLGRNSFFEIVTICSALGVLFLTWWRRWFFFLKKHFYFHTDPGNTQTKRTRALKNIANTLAERKQQTDGDDDEAKSSSSSTNSKRCSVVGGIKTTITTTTQWNQRQKLREGWLIRWTVDGCVRG